MTSAECEQAGWVGKGKKPGDSSGSEHVSRPLASLKDPSSFGPPPKNVNYHGGAALPNEITPHRGGIGAPLTQEQISSASRAVQPEEAAEPARPVPALPYRANTTGLATDHFAPPPVRRDHPPAEPVQASTPKPGLPPRLPARQNTNESVTANPPPSYDAVAAPAPRSTTGTNLNRSAVNRLGNAGIDVPGLGIGRNDFGATASQDNPWKGEHSQNQTQTTGNTMSELQSRFSRMNSSESASQVQPAAATSPPTMQQTTSAFNTAQNFRRDPSSVSVSDAKDAATTANSAARSASAFREKHSGSIAAAQQRGNAFNNKYQIQSRFEKFLDKHAPLEDQQQQGQQSGQIPAVSTPSPIAQQPQPQWPQQHPSATPIVQTPSSEISASISRKPPPPPPPKKPSGMHGNSVGSPPPPVPLGTKPGFS
jgi:hypothetical protein